MWYQKQVAKQMLTIKEASIESELSVTIIRRMTADPRFACFTINDGGRLFISRNAIAEQLERMKNETVSVDTDIVDTHWNWNIPNIKYFTVDELKTFLGISRNTAYDLIKQDGFPVFRLYNSILISAPELTKWLDKKAIRFHGLKRYNGIRKNSKEK